MEEEHILIVKKLHQVQLALMNKSKNSLKIGQITNYVDTTVKIMREDWKST